MILLFQFDLTQLLSHGSTHRVMAMFEYSAHNLGIIDEQFDRKTNNLFKNFNTKEQIRNKSVFFK